MSRCTILIGGDVRPGRDDSDLFRRGEAGLLFGELLDEIRQADFSAVNLECPLIRSPSPIVKSGPVFGSDVACIEGLRSAGVNAVGLANNHMMDHGAAGLATTIEACRSAGIRWVGAGPNLAEAARPLLVSLDGLRIGLLAVAEREFCIAGRESPGAAPLDPIDFCRFMAATRGEFDHLVVLVHGGAEYFPYPTPRLLKTCRFLVEQGASAVVCQHSHCPGAYEWYLGSPIVYGQGNLITSLPRRETAWHQGFLVKLTLADAPSDKQMSFVPYLQSYGQPGARKMSEPDAATFLEEIEQRSAALADEQTLGRKWLEFCLTRRNAYFGAMRGHGRILAGLNRRLKFAERLFSRRQLITLLNLFRCESNREAVETILEHIREQQNAVERGRPQ